MSSGAVPLVALVGNPNCGKTALFNLLTGSRQKVGNYAGVTVERKEGRLLSPSGRAMRVLDLPGAYSLRPRTPDEQITCDFVLGRLADESLPDLLVAVVDATNLRRHLRLVIALRRLGRPMVVALNMVDLARRRQLGVDAARLSAALGLEVVETVGVRGEGAAALVALLERLPTVPGMQAAAPTDRADVAQADLTGGSADSHELEQVLERLGLAEVGLNTP